MNGMDTLIVREFGNQRFSIGDGKIDILPMVIQSFREVHGIGLFIATLVEDSNSNTTPVVIDSQKGTIVEIDRAVTFMTTLMGWLERVIDVKREILSCPTKERLDDEFQTALEKWDTMKSFRNSLRLIQDGIDPDGTMSFILVESI